jgi:hypothetical protein
MNNENETEKDKDYKNFELLYSPRTNYARELEYEQQLFNDLTLNFDPITIKIIKKHFKERLGSLKKIEFVTILKNHLLSWHPELPDREVHLVKLLSRLFSEIDLNDNGDLEWAEFTNYIIHNSNGINKQSNNNNPAYRLRFYYPTKIKLDLDDAKSQISMAYYIEKYNILAIVQDGRSQVNFYNCKNFEKLKCFIELNEIQKEIDELEKSLGAMIPFSYKDFLYLFSNGLTVMTDSLYLYGKRRSYNRSSIEFVRQPYDIIAFNQYEIPQNASKEMFFIGGYNWDSSHLYMLPDQTVHYCRRYDATSLLAWDSLPIMLEEEIGRLYSLFDSNGVQIDDTIPTTPI